MKIFKKFCILIVSTSTLVSLAGCEFLFLDAEGKINAAVPLPQEVQITKGELLSKAPAEQKKKIENEFASKLKLRALTCAKGYSPSRFASIEKVQKDLPDRSCFNEEDANIARWIGMRRVAVMLAEPPLKPLPATAPKFIVGDAFIQGVQFAQQAGVVLLETMQSLQLLELESGKTIFKLPKSDSQMGFLSPNGRLFTSGVIGRVSIRSAETGAVILEVPKARAHNFRWIDDKTALYNTDDSNKLMLVDFVNGSESPVSEIQGPHSGIVPAAEANGEFLVGTYRTIVKAAIDRTGQGASIRLIDEKPAVGRGWALNTSGLTADGKRWFSGSKELTMTSLATLEQEKISFEPLYVQTAIATPDPNKILLTGFVQGVNSSGIYLFSFADRTISQVDKNKLVSTRLLYIPTLKKLAAIADSKIAVLDELPTEEPVALTKFMNDAQEAANQRKLDEAQRMEALQNGAPAVMPGSYGRYGGSSSLAPAGAPAPFAELAKDAKIEAVGVYQPPRASGRPGELRGAKEAGTIVVRVRPSSKPVVLVLSSYEAVHWDLKLEPGARLAAVLVSSYKQPRVTGNGAARVMMMGGQYAYKIDTSEYNVLNMAVQRMTGKPIYYFQGRYEGSEFSVGG
jgi:hypothetical protein